jgi:hypothetical protein
VATPKTDWMQMDAGELREVLAAELAVWQTRGFDTPARAARWHRYARRLARLAKRSLDDVLADLQADAGIIRSDDAITCPMCCDGGCKRTGTENEYRCENCDYTFTPEPATPPAPKEITFRAFEFASAHEAIQHADAEGGEAVLVFGRAMVVDSKTLDMLYNARVEFAHLCDYEREDGSHIIIHVPVDPHD